MISIKLLVVALLVAPLDALRAPAAAKPTVVTSRRSAVTTAAAAGLALAVPTLALADSVEEIAARNAARAEEARAAAAAKADEPTEEGNPALVVGGALFASVALAYPFFNKNVERLGTKIATGGKDSGYGKYGKK